jgi:hypothetical protein
MTTSPHQVQGERQRNHERSKSAIEALVGVSAARNAGALITPTGHRKRDARPARAVVTPWTPKTFVVSSRRESMLSLPRRRLGGR